MSLITFGAELEWADVDRHALLPGGSTWNSKDYTIVNSSGIANDPRGEAYRWGGEINTYPVASPLELAEQHIQLAKLLDPTINYRCNLHIHVRIPGLESDLYTLQLLARRFREEAEAIWTHVEPIPMPDIELVSFESLFGATTRYEAALKRYKRRRRSHHYLVSEAVHERRMEATTPRDFWLAEPPKDKAGRPMWHLAPREAMNLRQVFEETNTIEFRHFPAAADDGELWSAATWVESFLRSVIGGTRVEYFDPRWTFPRFLPTSGRLEQGWAVTNFGLGRNRVLPRIAAIREARREGFDARPIRMHGQPVSVTAS